MLEPMRQQLRAQKVGGVEALARTAIAAARSEEPRSPTGEGTPLVKQGVRTPTETEDQRPVSVRLEPVRSDRQAAACAGQAEQGQAAQ
jgi:hypothetical protein